MDASINKSPILVTGCGRSGAGMVAGILQICGAHLGNVSSAMENEKIHNLEYGYLVANNLDTTGQFPIANTQDLTLPMDWRRRVSEIILEEGIKPNQPWLYKNAKIAQLWPIWDYAFPNAKWVIVRRHPLDIADACMHTSYMLRYNTSKDWLQWVYESEKKFVELIQHGANAKQIWPERMVKGNYEQLFELLEWLGLPFKLQEIVNFVDPKLWKSKSKLNIKV